jgi:hypothetical protein
MNDLSKHVMSWQGRARKRLQDHADRCFAVWCSSKAGIAWKNRKRRTSPYSAGFSLPDYHHDLIDALNRDDERDAKSIMLAHFV